MWQQQESETDALVGIIHTIQLERGTGRLTVRRGIDMSQEDWDHCIYQRASHRGQSWSSNRCSGT